MTSEHDPIKRLDSLIGEMGLVKILFHLSDVCEKTCQSLVMTDQDLATDWRLASVALMKSANTVDRIGVRQERKEKK